MQVTEIVPENGRTEKGVTITLYFTGRAACTLRRTRNLTVITTKGGKDSHGVASAIAVSFGTKTNFVTQSSHIGKITVTTKGTTRCRILPLTVRTRTPACEVSTRKGSRLCARTNILLAVTEETTSFSGRTVTRSPTEVRYLHPERTEKVGIGVRRAFAPHDSRHIVSVHLSSKGTVSATLSGHIPDCLVVCLQERNIKHGMR